MAHPRFTGGKVLGTGIGLRVPHYDHILGEKPAVGWFEIISENYMVRGGRPLAVLDAILDQYEVVQHGVGLYPGSSGGPIRPIQAVISKSGWFHDSRWMTRLW